MIDQKILDSFRNKRVLITGGTGLIGRQLVDMLCCAGAHVVSVSLDEIVVNKTAEFFYGDLTDFNFCKEITKNIDYVFHVAGVKGSIKVTEERPASFFVPLLMMNTNLLEASRLNQVKKLVYTSSIGAYPSAEIFKESDDNFNLTPMDTYPGWAKRMAEMQIHAYRKQYGLDSFFIVRPCNVYGPGDNFDPANAMVIPSLLYRIFNRENPLRVWGDGAAIRDFAYSQDIAEGIIQTLYYGTGEASFLNLGGGVEYTIRELLETLKQFLSFDYYFDSKNNAGYSRRVMDISLAREKIHYSPNTALLDGLKKTWNWLLDHHQEFSHKKNYFI